MTKKFYNQPEVNVAQINTTSMICVSGTGGTKLGSNVNSKATTDIQL
ncbi:MAG: hypothetical protein IJ047_03790 [Paludibacteraceae bacterium]|nr:hypothetical protein [Paludibacteraceae bacterium]